MKKYIVLLVSLFLFFFTQDVLAIDSCTTSEMTRLKELASNVEFKTSYEFSVIDEEFQEVYLLYDIDIINFDSDLKIVYKDNYFDEEITLNPNQNKIEGYGEKEKITFYIYSYTNNLCTDELLKKVKIDLPIYNEYYYFNKEKCDLHPDFKYCKEFMDVSDMNFSEIEQEFDDYLKEDVINNVVKSNNFIWYIVGGVIILLGFIIIIIVIKKRTSKEEKI